MILLDLKDYKVPTVAAILSWGWISKAGYSQRPSKSQVMTLALAELLAPCLPENLSATQEVGRKKLREIVFYILRHENMTTCTSFAPEGLPAFFATQPAREARITNNALKAIVIPQEEYDRLSERDKALAGPRCEGVDPVNIDTCPYHKFTFEIAYLVLIMMVRNPSRNYKLTGLELLAHVYSGVMKRGTLSTGFKTKVENGVQADLNVQIDLDIEACSKFYTTYGK